jgi:hypothetical protein
MNHHRSLGFALFAALGALLVPSALRAWDYDGHRLVNQIALASLPAEFPAFAREAASAERVAFLAGEPDRWRNVPDVIMRQSGGAWTDHFCDLEQLADAGLDLATLPSLRYDFAVAFAAGRAAHPDKFPAIDPAKNTDHTREWPGFAPWAITEYYLRLKSGFAYLKTFQENGGTPAEIANAEANIVYIMGVMGHYVGDCAQPLHTTVHHNGWVGPNPNGYDPVSTVTASGATKASTLHSWIDGGFIGKAGVNFAELSPRITPAAAIPVAARPDGRDPMFVAVLDYLLAQHKLVEPLYIMDKAGKFRIENGNPPTAEGRAFITAQLLKGGNMLGAIWVTAWRNAPPDTFLRSQLLKRQAKP